ncbi:ABC transporter permease [Tessaracoccus sp. MC1756]|uniref:ABC transporter permease n=1 Tax=Tessaracoccus sp. MC1756 TaxID=2760311 RepID=UPI0015FFFA02|nr:ABC transporter permease [Tessaracoccus sp. MC1756]MBB1510940.1 ABC transporter permease [Tessaracoccus sp. MC1756]
MTEQPQKRVLTSARFRVSQGLATMVIAVIILFLVSAFLAPSSVTQGTLLAMFPFAVVLAIAGLGQMLVVQQAGFDLSIPGAMGLTLMLVTHLPSGDDSKVLGAVVVAYAAALAAGLLNGLLVGRFGLNAIIATLGTNAVLFGVVIAVSGGTPRVTARALGELVGGRTLGVPNSVIFLIVLLVFVGLLLKKTVAGRRFEAVGGGAPVAAALGLRVRTHKASAYVWAQVLYTTAAIILAGLTAQPTAYLGNNYLLPSVAVVVLAGVSLRGGKGFPVAAALSALFLTQLDQLTLSFGMPYAARSLIQAIALALGVALYTVDWGAVRRRLESRRDRSAVPATV